MTDERAVAVLRVLEADLPPSTVDIDGAVRAGRRRERTRRGLAAGALAGVTVLAGIGAVTVLDGRDAAPPARNDTTAASTTAKACVAARLPEPPGRRVAWPGPASPNGRHAVGHTDNPVTLALWTDTAVTTYTIPAGVFVEPHAVNDAGVIVGPAQRDGRTVPFVIRAGVYSELPLPAGAQGVAQAVNARGDIAGEAFLANGDSKAVLWKATGVGVTTLPSTTRWAAVHAIGDDGTTFGTLDDGGTPYLWAPDGTGRALPGLAGSQKGKAMEAAGDYVLGHVGAVQASGGAKDTKNPRGNGGQPRWVRWQVSTGTVVEVTGLTPSAVDATGTVFGSVRRNATTGPARWRDGTVTELPGPGGAPGPGEVVSVSRDGTRLFGWTGDVNAPVPTVWTC